MLLVVAAVCFRCGEKRVSSARDYSLFVQFNVLFTFALLLILRKS